MTRPIAVVGLWHLGCSITAAWTRLGASVRAVDFDPATVEELQRGRPPLYEPGLREAIEEGLAKGALTISTDPASVKQCAVVFLAYDTPVRDDDSSDLTPIWAAVDACGPNMDPGSVLVVSAQLPVGTSREIRARLKRFDPSFEVVYSPENLRLGEAIACYLKPGHLVIGADAEGAGDVVEQLFAPMQARVFRMNLPSAELVKHCINSFLATSVTLANQWSDIAGAVGADFTEVAKTLRADPRIGERAYITPGIGFSGGTLGRDLRVLDGLSHALLQGQAPLFGEVWSYNQRRPQMVRQRAAELLGGLKDRRIALLGMTYKPGTSTLRRSLPLAIARDLIAQGAEARAHDPKADWTEAQIPAGLHVSDTPYEAADGADLVILLTEWPEYRDLDFGRLSEGMRQPLVLDPKEFLRPVAARLRDAGLTTLRLTQPSEA